MTETVETDEGQLRDGPALRVVLPFRPAPHRGRATPRVRHGLLDVLRRTAGTSLGDVGFVGTGRKIEDTKHGVPVMIEVAVQPDPPVSRPVVTGQRRPPHGQLSINAEVALIPKRDGGLPNIHRNLNLITTPASTAPRTPRTTLIPALSAAATETPSTAPIPRLSTTTT
ncbi:hypothetical protein AB0O34_04965 [Sphaerisporangium sp. NPDC088356]|uniref:hypothetical protein n=1 Tax=Sphaerisporangium sp. NPDC088356 TaxID=3154871 RepID=UPI00343A41F6